MVVVAHPDGTFYLYVVSYIFYRKEFYDTTIFDHWRFCCRYGRSQ